METLGTWLYSRACSEASLWPRISKANSMFYAKEALLCDPKLPVTWRIHAFYSTCAAAVLRTWELGKLRRVLCLRKRPTECWADHMKRTGPIVARQLKRGLSRLQTLAMRRVRITAWQMVRCRDAQVLGRVCDMALR